MTAAFYALSGSKLTVMEVLLNCGADINDRLFDGDDAKTTMAMWAAEHGEAQILQLLKNRGADLSIALTDGSTVETFEQAYEQGRRPPSPADAHKPTVSRSDNRAQHYMRKLEARLFAPS